MDTKVLYVRRFGSTSGDDVRSGDRRSRRRNSFPSSLLLLLHTCDFRRNGVWLVRQQWRRRCINDGLICSEDHRRGRGLATVEDDAASGCCSRLTAPSSLCRMGRRRRFSAGGGRRQ
nr:hypothetical protein Itr_chr08CG06110 [Ipomoea trifida]GLL37953.1 hypothetical protein Itr_chr10CG18260 [Ipomoea trifida]GLL49285.1 hypothetical protein Itr_chr15CG08290 [Ipomoea trifida]